MTTVNFELEEPQVLAFSVGEAKLIQGPPGENGQDGKDGQDGQDGKSAWAYAVEQGFAGSEAAFGAMMASVPEHAAAANTARLGAESAQSAAEEAQSAAEAALEDAVTAREMAETAASAAAGSASAAANAAAGAVTEAEALLSGYVTGAETAKSGAETAQAGAVNAKTAAETAKTAAENAQSAAAMSASAASGAASEALDAETAAASSAELAADQAALSESWAVGGTGTRQGEDTDNAQYYASQAGAAAAGAANAAASAVRSALQGLVSDAQEAAEAAEDAADRAAEAAGGDFATPTEAQGYAASALADAKTYTDQQIGNLPAPDVSGQIAAHNAASNAHQDIRNAVANKVNNATFSAHTSAANPHNVTAEQVGALPDDWTPTAEDVLFEDGETLRAKYDEGQFSSHSASGVLYDHDWTGDGPYTQTVEVEGVTEECNILVGVAADATLEQRGMARMAMLTCVAQGDGTVTITADGDLPTADIPITVIILP